MARTEAPLDTTREAVVRLLRDAHRNYTEALEDGKTGTSSYWLGYMVALRHVLESENE